VTRFFRKVTFKNIANYGSDIVKILHTQVSSFYTNVYFYYDENTMDAVIIDPGADCDRLLGIIEEHGLKLQAILLTHGHFDHIGAVNELREKTGVPVMAYEGENELLLNPDYNESVMIGRKSLTVECDKLLKEGDIIEVGSGRLAVIHTPGHTAGGICFYDKENALLFAGDTLFKETTGRFDLVTGSEADLIDSIKNKLFKLPDNVRVLPGHNAATTIGHEKVYNFVVGSGR